MESNKNAAPNSMKDAYSPVKLDQQRGVPGSDFTVLTGDDMRLSIFSDDTFNHVAS